MVTTWALKGLLYHDFGAYLYTIVVLGAFGTPNYQWAFWIMLVLVLAGLDKVTRDGDPCKIFSKSKALACKLSPAKPLQSPQRPNSWALPLRHSKSQERKQPHMQRKSQAASNDAELVKSTCTYSWVTMVVQSRSPVCRQYMRCTRSKGQQPTTSN